MNEFTLPFGENLLSGRLGEARAQLLDGVGPIVQIVGSIQRPLTPEHGPGMNRPATTLAIRMDQKAAIDLAVFEARLL